MNLIYLNVDDLGHIINCPRGQSSAAAQCV